MYNGINGFMMVYTFKNCKRLREKLHNNTSNVPCNKKSSQYNDEQGLNQPEDVVLLYAVIYCQNSQKDVLGSVLRPL